MQSKKKKKERGRKKKKLKREGSLPTFSRFDKHACDKLMSRLEHVKRTKGSVCNDGVGKYEEKEEEEEEREEERKEEKERRKKEGEVPVQLHSFTFPASMSHT